MNVKKAIRYIGNLLTVIALVLLVRRLLSMDIDYSLLLEQRQLLWTIVLVIAYSINVAAVFIPWRLILQFTAGKKVPMPVAQNVICKSNLLKYIPGNVFQYVGRNEIAVLYDLKHSSVALATILDISANVLGVLTVSVFCYAAGLQIGLQSIMKYIDPTVLLIVAVVGCFLCVMIYRWKSAFVRKVMSLCTWTNIRTYALCIAFYIGTGIYTGVIYYLILTCVLGVEITTELTFIVIGAYQLSWLMGFITPGAPAGIGIRETVIVALLSAYITIDSVLLGIVLYRLANTIGDFLAFAISSVICLCYKYRINDEKKAE